MNLIPFDKDKAFNGAVTKYRFSYTDNLENNNYQGLQPQIRKASYFYNYNCYISNNLINHHKTKNHECAHPEGLFFP